MRRLEVVLLVTALISCGSRPALAARVSGIRVTYADGQTFLTWATPVGSGWQYHVYRATTPAPPGPGAGLSHYQLVGSVGDSTWRDQHLSSLRGVIYPFALPGGEILDSKRALFVRTSDAAAGAWYAVTCEKAGTPQDSTVAPGVNATTAALSEWPDRPQPVYQRTLAGWGTPYDVYTLWTSNVDTPFFPSMCNRPSWPYDCAVVTGHPAPLHALIIHLHARGGDFTQVSTGTGTPGEYVVNMDDYVATEDWNTFWFGYDESYDITAGHNPTAAGAMVEDYTMQRVVFTTEWARRAFPVDTTRVYETGVSMGAIGGVFLALRRPDLIAAIMVNVPLFDFSFESDPNPACPFNVGGSIRTCCDRQWGTVDEQLPGPDGQPVYDLLNANVLVSRLADRFVPPMIAFSGRCDTTLGWAEKPRFYATMERERAGGSFFFDMRSHSTGELAAWAPMMDYTSVYRFRTDRSFPAFSRCSANGDPGDGRASSGDSVGTINGYMDWDTTRVVDQPVIWAMKFSLRDLPTRWGMRLAPDSVTVDVTPRRTQQFRLAPYQLVDFTVNRVSDRALVNQGQVYADKNGIVTVPRVKVSRAGTTLTLISEFPPLSVGRDAADGPMLSALPNPLRGACALEVSWPHAGAARLDLLDVGGRRVRSVFDGAAAAGIQHLRLDTSGLPPGLYLVRASQGTIATTRRVAILH